MTNFRKWNDLNAFHEVVKSLGHNRVHQKLVAADFKITYGLKVKLHGTNAAVRIEPDGKVIAQKRSSDLLGASDNAGFRAWVETQLSYFEGLAKADRTIVIYGEWAGPGIQSGVAVSDIPEKHFFVFSVDTVNETKTTRFYCPYSIANVLDIMHKMPNRMIVLPISHLVTIDFVNKLETDKALIKINLLTEKIGENDHFIEELFDVKGSGEGYVAYPMLGRLPGICYENDELEHFSYFNFKSKSEHHRVNKTKAAVNFDPEKFANKLRFADAFCTEARFEQGWREFMGEDITKTMRDTGNFVAWVCRDVQKESKTEQAEMPDMTWASLSKAVSSRAALWFKDKVSKTL